MNKNIFKYIENGFSIQKNYTGTYTVFTVPTQHFTIKKLKHLTKKRFAQEAKNQKKYEKVQAELLKEFQS